jgi:hypothetical protein
MKAALFCGGLLALIATRATAQESQFASDVRREMTHVSESCSSIDVKALGGCAYTVATESPLHVALGSLAPLNGFAFGLAFDEHYTPNESWRLSWNADAVASFGGNWRAGVYMKLIRTPSTSGVTVHRAGDAASPAAPGPRALPVFGLFAQTISLDTINYFGSGPSSVEAGRSLYGERETIVGGSVVYPLNIAGPLGAWQPALVGGVAGRFIAIRSPGSDDAPPIDRLYDERTAPGLTDQRAFAEFREGLRLAPSLLDARLRLNYLLQAQQFGTSGDTHGSFFRWTADLQHEIPIYRTVSSTGPKDFNGPDECSQSPASPACPPVQWSRNREGTIGFRLLLSTSTTSGSNRVPFYLQPTLGGSDLNGDRLLASYQDYRFRGPDLLALEESVEHSLWGPFGVFLLAEQGKVGETIGDLGFSGMATSVTIGATLRAGGFPMVNLSFSWGGEGHHIIGAMNTTLLGGSARPSLF